MSRVKNKYFCLLYISFFRPCIFQTLNWSCEVTWNTDAVSALQGNEIKPPPISGRDFEVQSSESDDADTNAIRSDSNTVIRGGVATQASVIRRRTFSYVPCRRYWKSPFFTEMSSEFLKYKRSKYFEKRAAKQKIKKN
jgi:hypothetical protein